MVFGKPLLLTLSKIQWKQIGKQAGWLTKAQSRQYGEAYPEPEERYEDEHSDMQHDQEDIQHEGQIEEPQEKAVSYLWEKKGIENPPLEQIEPMVYFTLLLLRQGVTSLDSNLMGRAKDYLIKVDKTPTPFRTNQTISLLRRWCTDRQVREIISSNVGINPNGQIMCFDTGF